jgi:hypothetical protein
VDLADWILPVLLLAIWVPSWWRGTRRFRLRFALLAPVACVVGIILGLIGANAQSDGSCSSSCDGSAVQRWADSVDSPSGVSAWLGKSSLLAFGVAVALTLITLIVEYILLVRRDSREARSGEPTPSAVTRSDLVGRNRPGA